VATGERIQRFRRLGRSGCVAGGRSHLPSPVSIERVAARDWPTWQSALARDPMNRNFIYSVILFVFSFVAAIAFAEIALRLKNSSMTNYDIEMWRYAKELKQPSPDPVRGHEHLKNASAVLQSVNVRTNDWGLRGGPVAPRQAGTRRILVLGIP
jgi:hypothetical protein